MSNENVNSSAVQGTSLEELKKEFENYKNNQKDSGSGGNKPKGKDILKKYFTPREDREIFRPLPKQGKKHIQEAYFHVVKINAAGGTKRFAKIYCPARNNPLLVKKDSEGNPILDQNGKPVKIPHDCPLCNKARRIMKKQDQSVRGKKREELSPQQQEIFDNNKKIFMDASQWEAKKFYILRGVDKGKPVDGVKFWRFKHNFKNQGVFDKLLPVLTDYIDQHNVDFADPEKGTDLSIIVTDGVINKRTYRQVTAITPRGPSKLSEDPLVAKEWLNDKTTWRDVFKPKTAPNITAHEYLEMLVNGQDPYWDDSDPQNKKWVFPGRPDLEEKANNRQDDLGVNEDTFKQASDIEDDGVTINNVTEKHVGEFEDTGTDVGQEVKQSSEAEKSESSVSETTQETETTTAPETTTSSETTNQPVEENSSDSGDDYDDMDEDFDDLPF